MPLHIFYGGRQGINQPNNQILSQITCLRKLQTVIATQGLPDFKEDKNEITLEEKTLFQQCQAPAGKRVHTGVTLAKSGLAHVRHPISIFDFSLQETGQVLLLLGASVPLLAKWE